MIIILRLAAGILLAGIVFWAISNVFNWMRGSSAIARRRRAAIHAVAPRRRPHSLRA